MPEHEYRFDRFTVQPTERRLLVDSRATALGPRAFDLLVVLVEQAGHLVTRDELTQRVWKKLVVEEGNLHVQISHLRKILGSAAIETVQGVGYRLLPRVDRVATGASATAARDMALPVPITTFVGREREVAELVVALDETRLLTLTGIGGSGKTRLALKLAETVSPVHPGGVWFVDLAPIGTADRVAQTTADAIGIRPAAGQTMDAALQLAMSGRSALLVIDNCEHLKDACAKFVHDLLESVFDLKVVATSREALGVAGERRCVVLPLSLPGGESEPLACLASSDAVQLFVERARSVRPDFEFGDTTAAEIVELCRHLDGIPLAIELAAATLSVLSLSQLRRLLHDRFRLLEGRSDIGSRHRGLADVIEWSYERLDPPDRRLLERWSVFAGTWSLAAAVALAGDETTEAALVKRLVGLVDRSLIHAQYGPGGEMRYRMLETIRDYMRLRLMERGEVADARVRHFHHYLELAERWNDGTASAGMRRASVLALDSERDNLVLAHHWCDDAPNADELGIRLVNAMLSYWVERHFMAEMPLTSYDPIEQGLRLTTKALNRPEAKVRTRDRCRALWGLSRLELLSGHLPEAVRLLEESLAIARELSDDALIATRLDVLARLKTTLGDRQGGWRHAEEAREIATLLQRPPLLAATFRTLSDLAYEEGDLPKSEALAIESIGHAHKDSARSACQSMLRAASVCAARSDRNGAAGWLRQALDCDDVAKDARWGTEALQLTSFLAGLDENWGMTARLGACARRYVEEHKFVLRDRFDVLCDSQMELAERSLGAASYESEMQLGRQLVLDAAIEEARELLVPAGRSTDG